MCCVFKGITKVRTVNKIANKKQKQKKQVDKLYLI